MTPEERYRQIDARLDRTARLLDRMALRHMGIRSLYRRGVHRVEEILDRMEHQDKLMDSLIDSQLRTEASLKRLADTVDNLANTVDKYIAGKPPANGGEK